MKQRIKEIRNKLLTADKFLSDLAQSDAPQYETDAASDAVGDAFDMIEEILSAIERDDEYMKPPPTDGELFEKMQKTYKKNKEQEKPIGYAFDKVAEQVTPSTHEKVEKQMQHFEKTQEQEKEESKSVKLLKRAQRELSQMTPEEVQQRSKEKGIVIPPSVDKPTQEAGEWIKEHFPKIDEKYPELNMVACSVAEGYAKYVLQKYGKLSTTFDVKNQPAISDEVKEFLWRELEVVENTEKYHEGDVRQARIAINTMRDFMEWLTTQNK